MNKELKEDDRAIKISMPLLTEKEMLEIDNNFNEIVNKIKNQFIEEKDLAIAQYIINKQQKELQQKETILDKVTDNLEEVGNKYIKEYKDVEKLDLIQQNTTVLQELSCVIDDIEDILEIIEGEKK